jgi:hypothetical protein
MFRQSAVDVDRAIDLRLVSLVKQGYRGAVWIGLPTNSADDRVEVLLSPPNSNGDRGIRWHRIDLGARLSALIESEARTRGLWWVAAA